MMWCSFWDVRSMLICLSTHKMVGTDSSSAQLFYGDRSRKVAYTCKCVYAGYEGGPLSPPLFLVRVLTHFSFHYGEICSGLVFGRWRISLTKWSKNNQFQMFPVFVVMVSLTILISCVRWNFSSKLLHVDIKYWPTLCVCVCACTRTCMSAWVCPRVSKLLCGYLSLPGAE